MITTVFTATVLAAALAGGPQASPARPCPQAADGWRRLLSEAELPDGVRRWFGARVRLVLATACGVGRTSPELPPRAVRGDAEDILSGSRVPRSPDATVSGPGSSSGSGSSGGAGSSGPGSPTRVRQPAVVSSARPEVSRAPSGPSRAPSASTRRSGLLSPGQTAVAAALRQVGRPYVWGGGSSAGPTGGGFDCSGLALHAWSRAGAALTHYTGSQFRQGRRVPFSQLRPGDLVFFGGGTGDPTHVGVYVKNGVMVHAPKTGDVVRTTDFAASTYYRSRYRGAVRPAPRTAIS